MRIALLKILLIVGVVSTTSVAFAAAYNPFNTPVCLTSQVLPWNQLPGQESGASSNYAVQITNNCGVALNLVETTATANTYNVYPFSIATTLDSNVFAGALSTSYYIPLMQATPSGSTLPYFSPAFQLFDNNALVTGSATTATGDLFKLYYNSSATQASDGSYPTVTNLYSSAVTLASNSWYAIALGTQQPQSVQVSLTNTNAPQYNLANITFTQTAAELGLPVGSDFVIDLNFSATAFSYLGTYEWHPLTNPILTVPVSLSSSTSPISLNYTINAAQAPTSPKAFTWDTCTTTTTAAGSLSVAATAGASFPSLAPFSCVAGTEAIKHNGIEGMPLNVDDGSVNGLSNNINNLNAAETGVILGFANILTSDSTIELGTSVKSASQIATLQNNILTYQASGHVVLLSFGGEETEGTTESIWQQSLATFNPAPTAAQLACTTDCAAVLNTLDPTSSIRNAAVADYETLIARYKPNGIDVSVPTADLNPLANEFTAEVLKTVMTDVLAENPNFVLSLSLQPTGQSTFGANNKALMTAIANQTIVPTYINALYSQFTTSSGVPNPTGCTSKTVTGTCIVNSLAAYIAEYTAIWPTPAVIYPGIIPIALQDYSDTIEIWPANLLGNTDQLDSIFSSVLTAQAAHTLNSVLFSYWDTAYDYAGGYVNNSYPSNQYQLELASYANTPFENPSAITWNPSSLVVTAVDSGSGTISWNPAGITDSAPSAELVYSENLYLGSSNSLVSTQASSTSPITFSNLQPGTSYKAVFTVSDKQESTPVSRTTWLQTLGTGSITWTPNLIAQANADDVSGFAVWNCATDSNVTAVLSYAVTIDGNGVVGTVDNTNCKVNFTGLKAGTTYNVTVSVSDNKNGAAPTTSPAKIAFATGSTAPTALAAPTLYTWDPKPDHSGILTFNDATGGLPPYTYQIIISPSGAPPSLPFTPPLKSCPYADCSQVYDNMYRVMSMTFGVMYTVAITATDASGAVAGMTMFNIMDSN